ncbi:hypothetical protein BKI52_02150 [marine bacterium AO1-C]|nr:hypothetical protein BKI52_02150 [marine bacterium AO1-C]
MKTRLHYFICLILIFTSFSVFAQRITVIGKVLEESGEALPGANIIEKGTTNGTVTDIDGKFSLKVSPKATLIISFVGFQQKEVKVPAGITHLGNIKLAEENSLEEVIVTAYAIQKQSSAVTGSVARIRRADITGKVAGVQVSTKKQKKGEAKTWKRSSGETNRVRLSIGDKETLPLQSRQMAVKVEGFRARVVMDCYFYNDKKRRLEGTFKLRLPNGASPYFFAFGETKYTLEAKAKDKQIKPVNYKQSQNWQFDPAKVMETRREQWSSVKQARVVPKQKAAKAYTQTVIANVDPALMEWSGADVFSCRVFPLVPGKMHHVVIGYDVNLLTTNDQHLLQLALGNAKDKAPLKVDLLVANMPATQAKVVPEVFAEPLGKATRWSWNDPQAQEIKATFTPKAPILLASNEDTALNYFATSFKANLPKVPKANLKENVVFLLDVSLSSQPDKFNVWLKTMTALLQNNRDVIKNFSVLCFNVEAFWWKKSQVKNTKRNIRRFLRFANRLSLEGATDLGGALEEVNQAKWLKNQSKYLFLMSDGDVTWGENNLYQLSQKVAATDELYAFSTGFSGTDPRILDYLTRSTKGAVFSIVNEEEVQQVSKNFRFAPWRIASVNMSGASDFILAGKPQYLYAGQQVILAGRQQKLKTPTLNILVTQVGAKRNLSMTFNQQVDSELAKRVYGQIGTTQLEELGYLAEKEAIQYAVYYQVPGQTCSLVMLESERDYQRFKIKKGGDVEFIKKNTVNELLQKLLANKGKQLGDAKGEFLHFLSKLGKLQGEEDAFEFKLPANMKALIDKTPADYFQVTLPRLQGKQHFARGYSNSLRANLQGGEPDYELVTKEAEKLSKRDNADAIRLLSSLVEKNPGELNLLRDVGFWMMKWGKTAQSYFILKRLIDMRPFQPSSYQLIAQALQGMGRNELAMLYYEVVLNIRWDSDYAGIENVVRVEYIRLLNKMLKNKTSIIAKDFLEQRLSTLKKTLTAKGFMVEEADLLVTINWNTDETDVDLHVKEAGGETCYYKNKRTKTGGHLSKDMTEGFGPEMYFVKKAPKGIAQIKVDYYSDNESRFKEKTKVYLCIYKNWGRPNETMIRQVITLKSEDILKKENKDALQLIARLKF